MISKVTEYLTRAGDGAGETITGFTVLSSILEILHVSPYGIIGLAIGIALGLIRLLFGIGE